ncbi:hypothetical protein [Paenibacillus chitinolyticus]|uniref:hypothetical protein n=1 Tax=Paenibacillus chitinolyticus TaxID=79263 RepID=UPI00355930C5
MNHRMFTCLDLRPCLNNCGTTGSHNYHEGYLSSARASFPEESFPFDTPFEFKQIPFVLFKRHAFDNIVTEGQSIEFPRQRVTKIHLLGTSSDANMADYVYLMLDEREVSKQKILLSHFISEVPFPRNECVIETSCLHTMDGPLTHRSARLWYDGIELDRPVEMNRITFEDNPCMHVFGLTLESESIPDNR